MTYLATSRLPVCRIISYCLCTTLICALLVVTTGCSSSDEPEPELNEIPTTEVAIRDGSESELAYAGKRLYSSGIYRVAREHFESLRANYPQGAYAEFAEIKAADTLFESRDYLAASQSYEQFIENHPGSPATPYCLLRAARSLQLSSRGAGRDTAPLEKAVEHYDKLQREYPDSLYARSAAKYRQETLAVIAESYQMIIDFYKKQDMEKAYKAREEEFAKKWQPVLDQETIAVEGSIVSVASRTLPAESSAAPSLARANELEGESVRTSLRREPASGKLTRIQHVSCESSGAPRVLINLSSQSDTAGVAQGTYLIPSDGQLRYQLPLETTRAISLDCFEPGDLKISETGLLQLNTRHAATVISITNPPRIILAMDQ